MVFVAPCEQVTRDGKPMKGWFRVTKGRAGDLLMRSLDPPKQMVEAGTRLILKLAAGHELTLSEIVAVKLLNGLFMMGSQKTQHQIMGHRIFNAALDEYLAKTQLGDATHDPSAQEKALRDLGLVG